MSAGNKYIDMVIEHYLEERAVEKVEANALDKGINPYRAISERDTRALSRFTVGIREGTYCPDPNPFHADLLCDLIIGYRLLQNEVAFAHQERVQASHKAASLYYGQRDTLFELKKLIEDEDWKALKDWAKEFRYGLP
jgi:hypothetical protein